MFSVVIPAYNCEKTIERVLDSVMNQTRKDLIEEVIIINDGSIDNTEAVIKSYIKKQESEMSFAFVSQKNMGVSTARNRGIMLAKADWIALLDSDDIWFPKKLERQFEVISNNPQMVFLGCEFPGHKGTKTVYEGLIKLTPIDLCIRSTPTTPSIVFKKQVGIELGLFDARRSFCEDICFFQKFLLMDSYYILCEDLVRIDIGKDRYGQNGLSSNLFRMHRGRDLNTLDLHRLHLLTTPQMIFMLLFNQVKFMRRLTITALLQK